jgi:predicted acyl esterase
VNQSAVEQGNASYQGDIVGQQTDDDYEEILFRRTFKEKTRLIGSSKATIWLSCPDHDDFDVFVQIRKADRYGKILRNVNIPLGELGVHSEDEVQTVNTLKYLGPTGILRASHRALDPILSKPHWPAHDHSKLDLIPPGQIVKLEISLWPAAIQFEPDEQLVLKIAGHHMTLAEFEPLRGGFVTGNKGRQVLYFGGEHESSLEIPYVLL